MAQLRRCRRRARPPPRGGVMAEPVRVDNSILRIVAECSTQVLIRYHHGYTSSEDRAELRAGSALHAALAAYLDPIPPILPDDETASDRQSVSPMAVFTREYRKWAEDNV